MTAGPVTFPFLDGNTRLLRSALGERLASGIEDYLDLFRDDAVLEIPYGRTVDGERVEGKQAIAAYMERLRGTVTLDEMVLTAPPIEAGDTVVLEYLGTVHAERNDVRFGQRYVAVVTLIEGRIASFREYSNPLLAQRAFADREAGQGTT